MKLKVSRSASSKRRAGTTAALKFNVASNSQYAATVLAL